MATAIHTEDLSKTFGQTKALVSLNLDVPEGEVIGYLGPNGAGKTTTIRLLLGLIRRDGGSGGDLRRGLPDRSGRGTPKGGVRARRGEPMALAHGDRDAASARPGVREGRHGVPGPADRTVRVRPVEEGAGVLQGQPPEAHPHRRPHDAGRPPAPRRADQRSGPADGAGLPRMRRTSRANAARRCSCPRTS